MHYDLIIIGMGLSGLMAAKTAVEAKRRVLLVGKGTGSLCLFSNTIDLLGSLPATEAPINALPRWIRDHPEHPYSRVGASDVEKALSSFLSLFPPPYSFQAVASRNALVLTGAGTFRPAYLLPVTMVAGISDRKEDALIVGFHGYKDFFANYVADRLGYRAITLPLPEDPGEEVTAHHLGRLFEQGSLLEAIGREIRKQVNGATRVGLPAILGIHSPSQVKKGLEDMVGAEVFEISTLPPSIPGLRIFNRFKGFSIRNGVTFLMGFPVSRAQVKGKRCTGIYVSTPPVETLYSADRYILATGRFMGGGLAADSASISEPIFGLPVSQPSSREEWFGRSFSDIHPIHAAGVMTDESLRPVNEKGELALENVWVAGTILAHHDSIVEKSREGIELATGYKAALEALRSG